MSDDNPSECLHCHHCDERKPVVNKEMKAGDAVYAYMDCRHGRYALESNLYHISQLDE